MDRLFGRIFVIEVAMLGVAGLVLACVGPQSAINELRLPVDSDTIQIGDDCIVKFDRMRKCPRWVFERLTSDDIAGPAIRTDNFIEPMEIPLEFRPSRLDYKGSGYDRGHAAPAADFKFDQNAMNASFSLANVFPQDMTLNRGLWADLEEKVRRFATESDTTVYVVTVPIWHIRENARKIAYIVIGKNRIHCPSHVGKACLIDNGGVFFMHSWIIPNESPNSEVHPVKLDDFRVSADEFERVAGVDIWSHLPDDVEQNLESVK
jgi:endonuclease G